MAALLGAMFVALSACTTYHVERLKPGMTSEEVSQSAGKPSMSLDFPEGAKAWYYINGPFGWTTFRVMFDGRDHVTRVEQVLTQGNFAREIIPLRTKKDAVLRALGRPGQIDKFPARGEEVWEYRYMSGTLEMMCDIHIDVETGTVRSVDLYRDPAYTNAAPA